MNYTFKLKIDCGNSAFCEGSDFGPTRESAAPELARIMRKIADGIENGWAYEYHNVYDINGNFVGKFSFRAESELTS